jgi:hypothetical protein
MMKKWVVVLACVGMLAGCVAPMLVGAGSRLLLAILQPMVGLDPNQQNLFEQPIIKNRLVTLLGPKYEPTIALLKTADTVQREGPLFYVVSRYTPVPELAEKAGFVWNSETNQMAVMLVTGGSPTVLAEKILTDQANKKMADATPQWPAELKALVDAEALKQSALQQSILQQGALPTAINAEQKSPEQTPLDVQAKQKAEAELDAEIQSHESSVVPVPATP